MFEWLYVHWFQIFNLVLLSIIIFHAVAVVWNSGLTVKRLDLAIQLLAKIEDRLYRIEEKIKE
jgi:hypothetical protein